MALPCLKNAMRIFAILYTTSKPTPASQNHANHYRPSVRGSRLEADYPKKGVFFACRFTTVSQPEPVAGVVANDRAECGDRNHRPNVEAGLCRGINGSEYEDRFARQGQSHTFQPHDERDHPIAMRAHKLL